MNDLNNPVEVLGIDAGGTMTDTFFVRADGSFVVGKAQSDADEAKAVLTSSVDALAHTRKCLLAYFLELRCSTVLWEERDYVQA